MGTGVGLVRGGLGWHSGASPRSPREVAGVGGKHCLLPLPLHLLSPGILFVTLLRAIMCVGLRRSPGQPYMAPHGTGAPSSGCRGPLRLSTGACSRHLQRSLQAQPCAAELAEMQPG